jgi:hypothetical protein
MNVKTAINPPHKFVVPSVKTMLATKSTALRRKTWFRVLNSLERSVLDLTVKYVKNIKSTALAKIVTAIISKLEAAAENTITRMVRVYGQNLARKISSIAVSWGNFCAMKWAEDLAFARYLSVCFVGTHT